MEDSYDQSNCGVWPIYNKYRSENFVYQIF